MNLCPCIYPLNTLKNGIINRHGAIALITSDTSSIECPPVTSDRINLANILDPKNITQNATNERISINFLPILYALSLASYMFSARYSLITILIATGIPAVLIFRNKLYILYA